MSTAAQLASVRALIAELESKKTASVQYAGRAVTLISIKTLYDREEQLIARLDKEQRQAAGRGGNRIHRIVPV